MKIELQGIGKRYHARWLFRNLNATVETNHSLALIGRNGSGKSTLLQIIYRYVVPTEGKVIALSENNPINEQDVPMHAAFVAPYLELPEELTLIESVNFHFKMRKALSDDMSSLINGCGLEGNENKQIKYFSSGMKQRLKLALAFNTDAPLLLLDEPCSNLDKNGINWYCDMMKKMSGKRTIIVASNQDYEYDFCNQILDVTE